MPTLLLIYLVGMTTWFAPQLIANGEIARLITVVLTEIVIIGLLFFFLRKIEKKQNTSEK